MRTLGKSQSQSSLRKTKPNESDLRPTTAPSETPASSGAALCDDTQIDRDEAAITTLAQTIKEANYILIGTGAGFSADSGLAVYKDIARVPAYDLMGLTMLPSVTPSGFRETQRCSTVLGILL